MTADDVQRKLEAAGLILSDRKRTGNDTGVQLRFKGGEIVNVFDNGTISPQGKNKSRVQELLQLEVKAADTGLASSRRVFVVYGHDGNAKTQLEAMLRR